MKNVLLLTDFSDNSWNAIDYALNFYKDTQCNFYLLHVHKFNDSVDTNFSDEFLKEGVIDNDNTITKSKRQLKLVLRKILKSFPKNNKHNFFTLADTDFFIDSLRKHIEEKKIDVLVLGTKGATTFNKCIIGSNTTEAITKVKCTTLVVPENSKFKKIKEIAFPTDFSISHNLQQLQPITEILDTKQTSLRVVKISKKKPILNSYQRKCKELLEDYFLNYKYSFHFLTNNRVEEAVQCFVKKNHIDMIAMSAKNLNYFQQILFQTKIKELSYQKEVPFLVVHD